MAQQVGGPYQRCKLAKNMSIFDRLEISIWWLDINLENILRFWLGVHIHNHIDYVWAIYYKLGVAPSQDAIVANEGLG